MFMAFVRTFVSLLLCITASLAFNGFPVSPIHRLQGNFKNICSSAIIASSVLGFQSYALAEESKKVKKPKVLETENGVKYIEVKKGKGNSPGDGDFVVINYTGFLPGGKVFDTTEGKGKKPLSFRMGMKQIIPGIEEVLRQMRPGGEVTCTIPSKLAYGSKGVCLEGKGCLIEPNTDLNYVVKLKAVALSPNL